MRANKDIAILKNIPIKHTMFLILIKIKLFKNIYDKKSTHYYRYVPTRINEVLFIYVKNVVIKNNLDFKLNELMLRKVYKNCCKIKKELSFNDFWGLYCSYIQVYKK